MGAESASRTGTAAISAAVRTCCPGSSPCGPRSPCSQSVASCLCRASDEASATQPRESTPIPHDPEADEELVARLDALLESRRLYLDPELTLARLSRALHVPAKQLSSAINRNTSGNVSCHVNGYRTREACRALEAGASVTDAMLALGLNTKSNFNREFRRITGRTPSVWRSTATDGTPPLRGTPRRRGLREPRQ